MVAEPDILLKALADASRRSILQVLLQNELAVSELVEVLSMPQSSVSRHLKVLRDAGLVEARHEGTSATYFPIRGQNGSEDGLRERLLDWSVSQELSSRVRSRLAAVLSARQSESDAYFARVAHQWDRMRIDCFGPAFHLEALTALLPCEWHVADVGTGTGYLLPILARRFARVIAVDPVHEMLEAARLRMGGAGLSNVEFMDGSATELPIADDTLDLCIASLVLHHDATPPEALASLRRVLKPGGRVLIVEQNAHRLSAFHEMMQDRWWGFEPDDLEDQLQKARFEDIQTQLLTSVEPTNRAAPEAPDLFVMTGKKVG